METKIECHQHTERESNLVNYDNFVFQFGE